MAAERITRDDLENSLRALQGGVSDEVEGKKKAVITGGVAAAVLMILLVFLLGKRAGKKKTTIVEIRRV